jgi:foldase protein PrsA
MAGTKKPKLKVKKAPIQKTKLSVEAKPVAKKNILKSKYTKYLVLAVFLTLLGALFYLSKSFFVAALVNGKPVTRLALIKNLEKTGGKQALDNLITQELIMQEARKENITVTDQEVQAEIESLSKDLESQGSTLDATLATEGISKQDLEKNIRIRKTVQMLLASEVAVSDEEVKKYFDENKETYGKEAKYEDLKDSIKKELEQGKLASEFQKWYEKLQTESDIKYFVTF